MPSIRLVDVTKRFGDITALDRVNLEIEDGEYVCILGPTGSGKTTLFHIIMGLLRPDSGKVEVFGRPRERIGLLMQDPDDQLFCPTVEEDIAFGPLNLRKGRSSRTPSPTERP